jgi:pilus assembly protein Flp/PilA
MLKLWKKLREKEGQSLVEYALILALVAIVVIAALTTLGEEVGNRMNTISNELGNSGA